MRTQKPGVRSAGFTRLELVIAVVVVGILVGITIPAFTEVRECACHPKNLSKAKTIYLGLGMYAADHEGRFPDARMSSNEAYQMLYPDYISSKEVFYLSHSAWTPDASTESSLASKFLEAGENHFAYVPRLNSQSNPEFPLVAEGFVEGNPGTYTSDFNAKGGVNRGRAAAVIRVDGSGRVEKVRMLDYRVYGATSNGYGDLFAPASGWLDADQLPLNPASK